MSICQLQCTALPFLIMFLVLLLQLGIVGCGETASTVVLYTLGTCVSQSFCTPACPPQGGNAISGRFSRYCCSVCSCVQAEISADSPGENSSGIQRKQ